MSKLVLLNSRLFVGGADLSGSGNKIELSESFETKKVTNWRSGGAEENIAGLASVDCSAGGQWEAGGDAYADDAFWAQRRTLEPWSVAPESDSDLAAGGLMYLSKMLRTKATWWGGVGDVAEWDVQATGTWPLCRGLAAHASGTPRTASGNGTSLNLGAVTTGQYVYANLHVLSISGTATPSLTVTVQSDDNTNFTSATDVQAFAAATTVSGQAIRIAGPLTDTWWRVKWAVTGTNPSFLFLVSMGIE